MSIKEEFSELEQNESTELMQKMLVFREKLYEDSRVNGRVAKAASTAMFALFGAYFKYNACCILYFCELAYDDMPVPQEAKHQKRVLCPKCQQDILAR
jgi:hypothetical protein